MRSWRAAIWVTITWRTPPGQIYADDWGERAKHVPPTSKPSPWPGRSQSGVFLSGESANWPEKIFFPPCRFARRPADYLVFTAEPNSLGPARTLGNSNNFRNRPTPEKFVSISH